MLVSCFVNELNFIKLWYCVCFGLSLAMVFKSVNIDVIILWLLQGLKIQFRSKVLNNLQLKSAIKTVIEFIKLREAVMTSEEDVVNIFEDAAEDACDWVILSGMYLYYMVIAREGGRVSYLSVLSCNSCLGAWGLQPYFTLMHNVAISLIPMPLLYIAFNMNWEWSVLEGVHFFYCSQYVVHYSQVNQLTLTETNEIRYWELYTQSLGCHNWSFHWVLPKLLNHVLGVKGLYQFLWRYCTHCGW